MRAKMVLKCIQKCSFPVSLLSVTYWGLIIIGWVVCGLQVDHLDCSTTFVSFLPSWWFLEWVHRSSILSAEQVSELSCDCKICLEECCSQDVVVSYDAMNCVLNVRVVGASVLSTSWSKEGYFVGYSSRSIHSVGIVVDTQLVVVWALLLLQGWAHLTGVVSSSGGVSSSKMCHRVLVLGPSQIQLFYWVWLHIDWRL